MGKSGNAVIEAAPDLSRADPFDPVAAITGVMEVEPDLSTCGYRAFGRDRLRPDQFERYREKMTSAESVEEFVHARAFLQANGIPIKGFGSLTSYGWKHIAERWTNPATGEARYVSNGMFIAAALSLGYRTKRDDGPNACLNIAAATAKAARRLRPHIYLSDRF